MDGADSGRFKWEGLYLDGQVRVYSKTFASSKALFCGDFLIPLSVFRVCKTKMAFSYNEVSQDLICSGNDIFGVPIVILGLR